MHAQNEERGGSSQEGCFKEYYLEFRPLAGNHHHPKITNIHKHSKRIKNNKALIEPRIGSERQKDKDKAHNPYIH